jgi:hypothetical protein
VDPDQARDNLVVVKELEHICSQSSHTRVPVQENEPSIEFRYEVWYACVPPTLVALTPKKWSGCLYIGSLSAALSESWLRWAGVTHVVCVLGKYVGQNELTSEWVDAHEKRFRGILYLDWSINYDAQRKYWREVFHLMSDALDSSTNVVLVHCRNGKDCSCFAVYAFLRMVHEMDHSTALWYVSQRVGTSGYPLFDTARQRSNLMDWVDSSRSEGIDPESGIYSWQQGSG